MGGSGAALCPEDHPPVGGTRTSGRCLALASTCSTSCRRQCGSVFMTLTAGPHSPPQNDGRSMAALPSLILPHLTPSKSAALFVWCLIRGQWFTLDGSYILCGQRTSNGYARCSICSILQALCYPYFLPTRVSRSPLWQQVPRSTRSLSVSTGMWRIVPVSIAQTMRP
jgi:hypothetical protein